jgi:hypothetical protein
MKWLDFVLRQKELLRNFRINKDVKLTDSGIDIRFFKFESTFDFKLAAQVSKSALVDGTIAENIQFTYPVFFPKNRRNNVEAIVLLHGLNERNWDKYLCWAEYLAIHTQKPVILFPMAYHMNRSPLLWSDPRCMSLLVNKRQELFGKSRTLCFANVALSERLSEDPIRFYTSGRQTVEDLRSLAFSMQKGEHPLFAENTKLDFFAYSIGAFLAEITIMANLDHLFDASKLFVFCGGSIFRSMSGESRFIMDKTAYDDLMNFYQNNWTHSTNSEYIGSDKAKTAFDAMISPEYERETRERFFTRMGRRIVGISLKKDKVMPFEGVQECMGTKNAASNFVLMDFPFNYSHESPFPTNDSVHANDLNESFNLVFSQAVRFLA